MKIYLVVHQSYEDVNAFFSSRQRAKEYIENQKTKLTSEDPGHHFSVDSDWCIIKLQEGVQFHGDLSDLFSEHQSD